MNLELGCGNHPTQGWTHHDRWKHARHIDLAFDLEVFPWPIANETIEKILATDVFEHLKCDVQVWLDECWRVLKAEGELSMRLPQWNNPYSWRDPTHQRVFHKESFLYWCPYAHGTVWRDFGQYYFGQGYQQWWTQKSVTVEANDLRFVLVKILS
jgi:Methyltransferase domain.